VHHPKITADQWLDLSPRAQGALDHGIYIPPCITTIIHVIRNGLPPKLLMLIPFLSPALLWCGWFLNYRQNFDDVDQLNVVMKQIKKLPE
jgi:hypothetical protein